MQTKFFSWMMMCAGALLFAATASARTTGVITAAKVRGTVTALHVADNTSRQLKNGSTLTQGYVVNTAKDSSVVLIFANGAAINLAQNSSLSIDEFLMDPFDPKYSAATAKDEASTSVTSLSLVHGELVGNVKHLRREAGSTFEVKTPVGAAGIRGTTFQFSVLTDGAGKLFASFGIAEGLVSYVALDGLEHMVPAGKNVQVSFDGSVNPATGQITVKPGSVQVSGLGDLSAAAQAAIAHAMEEILSANASTVTPGDAPSAVPPPVETTPGDGK